jgi:hypothetical protein
MSKIEKKNTPFNSDYFLLIGYITLHTISGWMDGWIKPN